MALSVAERGKRSRKKHRDRYEAGIAAWRQKNRNKILEDTKKRHRERTELLAEYKLAKGCVRCGYREHPHALQFDHLSEFKKRADVSSMKNWSLDVLWAEIAKCQVVCANCHAIETEKRRQEGIVKRHDGQLKLRFG